MILSWPTTVFWEYFKTDKSKLMKNGVAQSGGQLYIESMFTLHNLISQISPQLYILLNCSNSLSLQRINSVPNPYKPVIFSLPNTDLQKKELGVLPELLPQGRTVQVFSFLLLLDAFPSLCLFLCFPPPPTFVLQT